MSEVIGLFGAGGFGREVMPLLQEQLRERNPLPKVYFVDSDPVSRSINGVECIRPDEFHSLEIEIKSFAISISDSIARKKISTELSGRNYVPLEIRSESSRVYPSNKIGEGSIFCDNTIVTANAKIGKYFHCNLNSYVAHDCIIGDYVTFAPGVMCNGNVVIENNVYVGAGAVIRQGNSASPLVIGEGAVIGMGAIVTKCIEPNMTVVGNPARPIQQFGS